MGDEEFDDSNKDEIIANLDLNEEERNGVEKFLTAVNGFTDEKELFNTSKDESDDYYIPISSNKGLSRDQEETILNILQEFFSGYFLHGYDLHGNRVEYTNYPNDLVYDSLSIRAQKVYPDWILREEMDQQ